MGDEFLPVFGIEHEETFRGIVEAVIVKVARDRKMSLMGNGTLSANVKPSFAETKSLKPVLNQFIGDPFITKLAHGGEADLGAPKGTRRAVDAVARAEAMIKRVDKRPVGGFLLFDGTESSFYFAGGRTDSHRLFRFFHREKNSGRSE